MTVASTSRTLAAAKPLDFRRLRWPGTGAAAIAALGGRWVGQAEAALPARLLVPAGAVFDAWGGGAAATRQQLGCVRYATDGHWLHGVAEIDDQVDGLQAATRRAYADVFEVLAANERSYLLRLWNYLADINLEAGGIERYRQFNAGRQQAFIDARRSAFEGAPAACALGMRRGPLRVYFLAGRAAPLAIENPRQVSAYRYPEAYGTCAPTFSRAALVDAGRGRSALFISGTASIVGHATTHVGDVRRQTEESLANLAAVRAAATVHTGIAFAASGLSYTLYLRRAADLAPVRAVFEAAVGPDGAAAREAIYLEADICRADLLVEIEAHGFAPTGNGP